MSLMVMKQVILVRKDLEMLKGKMSSQVGHASVDAVLKSAKIKVDLWKKEGMKKVILKVYSEDELLLYQKKAKDAKLVNALIVDAGKTFFKKPTNTCLAIGPDKDKKIDKIAGKLKLLN